MSAENAKSALVAATPSYPQIKDAACKIARSDLGFICWFVDGVAMVYLF